MRFGARPVPAEFDELAAWVADLETDGKGVPVLLRQFLNLGARLVALNVDRRFSNARWAAMPRAPSFLTIRDAAGAPPECQRFDSNSRTFPRNFALRRVPRRSPRCNLWRVPDWHPACEFNLAGHKTD
jgi:hypothetical protein